MSERLGAQLQSGGLGQSIHTGLLGGGLFAGASLDLNFAATKNIGPLVTFTRASTGTYVGSNGVLQTAATDVPRFDHNPTTGESLGLLVEESRTNSIRNNTMVGAGAGTPGTLPTNWANVLVTGLTASVASVGTQNGISYIDVRINGTPSTSSFYNLLPDTLIAGVSGQTWTGSFWGALVGGSLANTNAQIELRESDASQAFLANTTKSITLSGSLNRFSLTRTLNNVSTAFVSVRFIFQVTSGLPVDFTFRIGLPQLEQGAFATSVIPTTDTAATRSADVASITGTNFSSWYRQDEGTVLADATIANTGSNRFIAGASDATVNEEIALYWNTVFNSLVNDGAVSQANSFGGTVAAGSRALHSFAYKANDFQGYGNAVALSADTSGTLPTADRLTIGSRVNSTFWLNGTIRRLTYWPQRLANSTLQAITL